MSKPLKVSRFLPRADRALALALGALLVSPLTGCAAFSTPQVRVSSQTLALMGPANSDTELHGRLEAQHDPELNEKALKGAFWGGVIVGAVGGVGTVGFGAAGAVAADKLEDGYAEGSTRDEIDGIKSRGKAYDALTITSATLAITGLAVAAISYGIDRSRCGSMRRKRDGCRPN